MIFYTNSIQSWNGAKGYHLYSRHGKTKSKGAEKRQSGGLYEFFFPINVFMALPLSMIGRS